MVQNNSEENDYIEGARLNNTTFKRNLFYARGFE